SMRASTNPASRSTRRCLETEGCGIRSERSISLTDLSDNASRLRMARRLGSAMMTKAVSTTGIYPNWYKTVKSYLGRDGHSQRSDLINSAEAQVAVHAGAVLV